MARQINKFRALTKLDPGEIIKYLYLRAFFKNDMNDRRIINKITEAFLKDLCFNLLTGKVVRSTSYLDKMNFKEMVSGFLFFICLFQYLKICNAFYL